VTEETATPPLLERISDYLTWYAQRTPRAEALVLGTQRITYQQLAFEVDSLSCALIAAGVRSGDRIATLATPHPDFFIVLLAASSIGAIWVGLNPRYRLEELTYVLSDSRPTLIFTRTRIGARDYDADIASIQAVLPTLRWIVLGDDPVPGASASLSAFVAAHSNTKTATLVARRDGVRATDPALIIYTSGSTGYPKGAVIGHHALVVCCRTQHRHWATHPLRTLNFFPINHIGCVGDISCFTLLGGGCIVFLEQFDPTACLALIAAERISFWGGVPTTFLLTLQAAAFEGADLATVQRIVWSGAAGSAELIHALAALGKWIGTSYGLTETVGSVTFTAPNATIATLIDTVGRPPPEYGLRIVDEEGRPVPAGMAGEIQVHGECRMIGYWQRPEATAEAFDTDGWLKTGDLAEMRPDGNVVLLGRRQDVFKSGGYNVFPREIEQVLERFSGVRLAALIGVADPLYGMVGHAFVVPERHATITIEDLACHCRQHLANYKVPKAFTVTSDLPMLPIGKIDKRALVVRSKEGLAAG
jgi:fatty-acyl-CoA synthase